MRLLVVLLSLQCAFTTSKTYDEVLNGKRVKLFTDRLDWRTAFEACLDRRMNLLIHQTAKDDLALIQLGHLYGVDSLWTNGFAFQKFYEDTNITWQWMGKNRNITETFWAPAQPKDQRGTCLEVLMEGFPHHWRATNCIERRAFICQEPFEVLNRDDVKWGVVGEEEESREMSLFEWFLSLFGL